MHLYPWGKVWTPDCSQQVLTVFPCPPSPQGPLAAPSELQAPLVKTGGGLANSPRLLVSRLGCPQNHWRVGLLFLLPLGAAHLGLCAAVELRPLPQDMKAACMG